MSALRDEAGALAQALKLGVCDVAEAIAWSDAQLLRQDPPPGVLCEVSLAHDRYPNDVADLLRQCPGAPDSSEVSRLLVTLLADRLKADAGQAGRVAKALYRMALAGSIEDPDMKDIAWWAWDALDLAEAGYLQESCEQVIGRMAAALDRAAANAATRWSFGLVARHPNV